MTEKFLKGEGIATAINEIFAGEGMTEQVYACLLDASLAIISMNGEPQGILAQHISVFITEQIIITLSTANNHIITQDINHLRAEGNDLNMSILCMPEYYLSGVQINVLIENVADGGGTASAVEEEVNNSPISVFAEITILIGLAEEEQKFVIRISFFYCLLVFEVGEGQICITLLPTPFQEGAEDP